jgi:large repetitive protein
VPVGSGVLNLDGQVSANGCTNGVGYKGGGSGGSLWITAGRINGTGTIAANGGAGSTTTSAGSGGGGGRIAVWYYNETTSFPPGGIVLQANGAGGGYASGNNGTGTVGTVYLLKLRAPGGTAVFCR